MQETLKDQEYKLLEAISEDETVTQGKMASSLEMAIGSVNWYIKRLVSRGYLKVTRMDRTRLRYNLTTEGMAAFRRNASQYAKDSLKIYQQLRNKAKTLITQLLKDGVEHVYLVDSSQELDIFRLSCLELGMDVSESPVPHQIAYKYDGYHVQAAAKSKETHD